MYHGKQMCTSPWFWSCPKLALFLRVHPYRNEAPGRKPEGMTLEQYYNVYFLRWPLKGIQKLQLVRVL